MSIKIHLTWPLGLLLASCATSGLDRLILDGHELHASLVTAPPDELSKSPVNIAVQDNPHLSTDVGFVEAIARRAAQGGPLDGEGIRAALLAVYLGERERLGIYGLEAASTADADRIEDVLRSTWAYNASKDLARVHRGGEVLAVVWTAGVSPSFWEAVNAGVARRLIGLAAR